MASSYVTQWAIKTVKSGLSANEGLRQLREAGYGIRRNDWLRLVSEVRVQLTIRALAIDVSLSLRPSGNQITAMTSSTASGYLQHVDVWVVDTETGIVSSRPYSLATDFLVTHGDAIDTALDLFTANQEQYGERVIGATYAGTYALVPQVF